MVSSGAPPNPTRPSDERLPWVAPTAERASLSRLIALLLVISVVGIALRFAALDRSYWFDELASLNTVNAPDFITVLQITARDNQPPLYNSVLYAWISAFGPHEIAVRSLSLVFGLLALAMPWLARRSLTFTEKLVCFTILCLMPLPIRYAQEARNYSLLLLMSCACLFTYYEILATRTRRLWLLFHACLVLLAFSHLFGLLLAVSFLAVMFWREPRIGRRCGLILYAAALSAVILVPLLRGGAGQHAGGNFWITFSAASLARDLLMVFTPAGLALLAYGFVCWRRDPSRETFDPALAPALTPFVLMLVGSVAISLNTPIVTDRNLIGLVAALALSTAWLLKRVLERSPTAVTVLLLMLLMVQAVVLTFSPWLFIQQDFRLMARRSIALDSKICYVLPEKKLPAYIFDFYVSKVFNRPDLEPEILAVADVPKDLSKRDCRLWSGPILSKRGASLLRTLPQFARCADVPLARPGVNEGSELLDCGS